MKARRRIVTNFFFLVLSQGFSVASSVILIAILARVLTPEQFGAYGVLTAVSFLLFPLPSWGTTRVLEREIARNPDDAPELLGLALMLRTFLGAAIFAFGWWFSGVTPSLTEHQPAILAMLVWVWLGPLANTVTEYLVAAGRLEWEVPFNLSYKLPLVLFVASAAFIDGSLASLFWGKALARVVQVGVMVWLFARILPKPQWQLDAPRLRYFLREGLPLQLSELTQMAFYKVDEVILGLLRSTRDVALFHGPYQLILGLSLLPIQMMRSAFPDLSRLHHEAPDRFYEAAESGLKITLLLGLPLGAIFLVGADDIVALVLGSLYVSENGGGAVLVMRILGASIPFLFAEVFYRFLLTSMDRQAVDTRAVGVGLAVNLGADLVLIPFLGAIGAAVGTLTGGAAIVWWCSYRLRGELDLPAWPFETKGSIVLGSTLIAPMMLLAQLTGRQFWLASFVLTGGYVFMVTRYGLLNDLTQSRKDAKV